MGNLSLLDLLHNYKRIYDINFYRKLLDSPEGANPKFYFHYKAIAPKGQTSNLKVFAIQLCKSSIHL